jgi:hypothetical protein
LVIRYQGNSSSIYSFDINVIYDTVQFDLVRESIAPKENVTIGYISDEVVAEDNRTANIEIKGYSIDGIEDATGDLINFQLISVKGEATSSISFLVKQIVVFDEGNVSFGQTNIGLSSVNFAKTAIPWWVWLIIFGGLALAIAGGYVFHLLLPDVLGDAAKATANAGKAVGKKTKEIAILTANKTKEIANRVFNRRPVAPKMKPSVSATSGKPVQSVKPLTTTVQPKPQPTPTPVRQKGDLTKPVQPLKQADATPQVTPVDPAAAGVVSTPFGVPLVSQKPMNQTIIKTRVVNPDGSVTTITKKVSKEAESSDDKK